jgi:hypothetical protein
MKLRPRHRDRVIELVLPARAEVITVICPTGERIQALVAERDDESLLVAPRFAERFPEDDRLDQLAIEFTSRSGRVRLQGAVTRESGEELRFRDLRAVEVLQQREYVRVPASRPATVSTGSGEGWVSTFCVDVSGGGMRLAGPATLMIGEQVNFRLSTSTGGAQISGTGTVVRIDPEGRPAICFDSIGEGDHRRLMRFVFECERAERRRQLERSERNGR